MKTTILDILQNAENNLNKSSNEKAKTLARLQLRNAIRLLHKGYSASDEIQPLLDKYGHVERIPEKNKINHL